MENSFLVQSTMNERAIFPRQKLPCQNPMLRQTKWGVRNGPITKTGP